MHRRQRGGGRGVPQGFTLHSGSRWEKGAATTKLLLAVLVGLAMVVAALLGWWPQAPLRLMLGPQQQVLDVQVRPGMSADRVAAEVVAAGVSEPVWLLQWTFRLSGKGHLIKAGSYELEPGITPQRLLDKLVKGEQATRSVKLLEGWTFAQFRQALAQAEHLKPETQKWSASELMQALGRASVPPEGRFFPDTYVYPKGSSDTDVWRKALSAMDKALAEAWNQRETGLPVRSPDELLTLASLVEKETGQVADRPLVAGVFVNRLRMGMRLQTDPSVVYGVLNSPLASRFDGRLRRIHLDTDTPFNTYTRAGFPPTPIAMPGLAALKAAAQPAATRALYFVARGDGSSQFSETLAQHNEAVRRYILQQP